MGHLSDSQLRLLITHELAHAKRWDNLVLLIQRLAEMFLFFHPVVWICGWIMRREAEAACDDAVVHAYGDSAAYADSLTRVAEMKCGVTRRLLVNTFAAAESNFSRRVHRVLTGRPGRTTLWLAIATAVAMVAIAVVGLPTATAREPKAEDAKVALEEETSHERSPVGLESPPPSQAAAAEKDPAGTGTTAEALERLHPHLTSEYGTIRAWGMRRLAELAESGGIERDTAIGMLATGVRDPHSAVRWRSVRALGALKARSAEGVEALVTALEDSSFIVRHDAAESIVQIGGYVPGAAPALLKVFATDRSMNRAAAMRALKVMRPEVIEDVAKLLGHANLAVRDRSIYILEAHPVDETRPTLLRLLEEEKNPATRAEITRALRAVESHGDEAVEISEGPADGVEPEEASADIVPSAEPQRQNAQTIAVAELPTLVAQEPGEATTTGVKPETIPNPQAVALTDAATHTPTASDTEAIPEALPGDTVRSDGKEPVYYLFDINGDGIKERVPFYSIYPDSPNTMEDATVANDGTRGTTVKLIDGVPKLAWGQGIDNTFAGSLAAATAVTAHPVSYVDIMGLTGLAFRVRWTNEDTATQWCPSTPVGEMPDECAAFARMTGWGLPTDVQFGEEEPDRETIRRKVLASIDAGKPVAAYGTCLDLAVIYGYLDDGKTLLLHDYHQPSDLWRIPLGKLGPMQMYLAEHRGRPDAQQALIEALKTAVANWKRERHHGGVEGREYWYGDAALRAWQHDLARDGELPAETWKAFHHLNRWNYSALKDARRAAATFLRQHAAHLGEQAQAALERAAKLYEEELAYLARWEQREDHPWGAESVDAWGWEVRRSERESLTHIRGNEGQAIAELENALRAEGIEVPAIATASAAPPSQPNTEIKDYRWKPLWNSQVACLKAAADHLGVEVSVPWLFGVTGYAFLLNVHDELCPSGWHVAELPLKDALAEAGIDLRHLTGAAHAPGAKGTLQKRAWDETRKALDAGLPCYGYDFEIGDYYAVYGYDDVGYYYSGPNCEAGKGPLPWQDYGVSNMVGMIYVNAVEKGAPADDRSAVREACLRALNQAREVQGSSERYACGPAGYEQWIEALEGGHADGWGPPYNTACYLEARSNGAAFLEEAKTRLDDGELAPLFDEAIAHYASVRDKLQEVARTFPTAEEEKPGTGMDKRVKTAVDVLRAAKSAEQRGLQALAKLAEKLGAAPRA